MPDYRDHPSWPRPDPRLIALPEGWIFVLVTAWMRSTYPARLDRWRSMWKPRFWKDVDTQRYVDMPPPIDVAGWRKALQGVE